MTGGKPMMSMLKRVTVIAGLCMALLLAGLTALPAMGQELSPEHLALARKYVDLTDKSGVFENTLAQAGANTYKQLVPQNPNAAEPINAAITQVIGEYRDKKGDLFEQFARVYALAFTMDELQEIVDFYSSPIGQKLVSANAQLSSSMARILNLYSINLQSEFFGRVRAVLKAGGLPT